MSKTSYVIVAAKRTPFGKFGGSLISESPTDMATHAARACLDQLSINPEQIGAVVMGNVVPACSDSVYLARHVALRLELAISTSAYSVNRLCGSGFEAVVQGIYLLENEGFSSVLVGGSESMSMVPFVARHARWGSKLGHQPFEDWLMASLTDEHINLPMAITAENLATQYGISREDVDQHALQSQQRAAAAWDNGVYAEEVTQYQVQNGRKSFELDKDEHIRPDATMESLAKLRPVFKKDGVVTAGNASGMVDGACALIVTTEAVAQKNSWDIMCRVSAWAGVGCDPKAMGIGPVPATKRVLEKYNAANGSSLKVEDFDCVEINEAFSAQYLAVVKELGLDPEKTNIHGGAISIGHPLGATGARLTAHMAHELQRRQSGKALVSACIGGGQGMSLILER